jgi:hypothetical protein
MDRDVEAQLCALQAQLTVQRIALRALARSHPAPDLLLQHWRAALTDATHDDPVTPASARGSDSLAELTRAFSEHWTAELVDLVVPAVGQAGPRR